MVGKRASSSSPPARLPLPKSGCAPTAGCHLTWLRPIEDSSGNAKNNNHSHALGPERCARADRDGFPRPEGVVRGTKGTQGKSWPNPDRARLLLEGSQATDLGASHRAWHSATAH